MSTYQYKGAGYGLPFSGPQSGHLVRRIDAPTLIANGVNAGLALVATPNTGVALASTGFASSDILEVFWVPKGTLVRKVGGYVITGEGATATIDVGVTASTETEDGTDADGWLNNASIETAGVTFGTTDATLTMGDDTVPGGELYITNGSIDILFNNAVDTAVFLIWAEVFWLGTLA
uniref:Putative structural protein n=1 Tax=viral metagenome TaxID=1070528 RepID=A0A6M3JLW3_9ZZZZ